MKSFRKALCRLFASRAVGRNRVDFCERLETRSLLNGDPVIVFTEAFSLTTTSAVTSTTVAPWLWHNEGDADDPNDTGEFLWTLGANPPDWDNNDGTDGKTKLSLGAVSRSFTATEVPKLILTLGANDTLTIDFTAGDMLANGALALSVVSDGTGGAVSVVGTSGNDDMTRGSVSGPQEDFSFAAGTFTSTFTIATNLAVTVDGAGGNDTLRAGGSSSTLVGGSGNDSLSARIGVSITVDGGADTDTLTVTGTESPDSIVVASTTITRGSAVVTSSNVEFRIINGGDGDDTAYTDEVGDEKEDDSVEYVEVIYR